MTCVSCDSVYHLGLLVFFHGVFLSSRVTGACSVTTNWILRVIVRNDNINISLIHMIRSIPQLQSDWSLSCDHGLDYAS